MKKIWIVLILALVVVSLNSCSKKNKEPVLVEKYLYTLNDFQTYFNVQHNVTYSGKTAYIKVNVSPKETIELQPNCYCTVWVIVDISLKVGYQTFTYTFYEDVLINLSTSGYGSGGKTDYRGETIVGTRVKNYDVKGIYIIVNEYEYQ